MFIFSFLEILKQNNFSIFIFHFFHEFYLFFLKNESFGILVHLAVTCRNIEDSNHPMSVTLLLNDEGSKIHQIFEQAQTFCQDIDNF